MARHYGSKKFGYKHSTVRDWRTEQSGKPGEGKYTMLNTFKTYSVDRMDVEEMVSLSAYGKSLKAEFVEFGLEVPEFVELQLKNLRRDIRSKISDKLEAEKKRLTSQLESLKTPQERKAELRKQLAKVNDQLED